MRTTAPRRAVIGLSAAIAVMSAVAACGGDDPAPTTTTGTDGADGGAPEVAELTVGIVPVADQAAVFIAVEQGFFEEEGLTVTPQPVQGGAAAVPALLSGDLQAVFATYPSFLLAESQGLGITIVNEGVRATETTGGVYVAADSPIQDAADLAGKTIAVNTLNNTGDVTIKAVLDEQGVDASGVQFIELPFPDMAGALEGGDVDAVWVVEPFRSGIAAAGGRVALASFSGVAEGIPVSGLAMSDEFVGENPNTAAAFSRAIEKANAYIAADPDTVRAIVTTYSQVTAEQAEGLELPMWTAGEVDVAELERWNDLMVGIGALTEPVDIASMVLQK